jgi:hypothetical protein
VESAMSAESVCIISESGFVVEGVAKMWVVVVNKCGGWMSKSRVK